MGTISITKELQKKTNLDSEQINEIYTHFKENVGDFFSFLKVFFQYGRKDVTKDVFVSKEEKKSELDELIYGHILKKTISGESVSSTEAVFYLSRLINILKSDGEENRLGWAYLLFKHPKERFLTYDNLLSAFEKIFKFIGEENLKDLPEKFNSPKKASRLIVSRVGSKHIESDEHIVRFVKYKELGEHNLKIHKSKLNSK